MMMMWVNSLIGLAVHYVVLPYTVKVYISYLGIHFSCFSFLMYTTDHFYFGRKTDHLKYQLETTQILIMEKVLQHDYKLQNRGKILKIISYCKNNCSFYFN